MRRRRLALYRVAVGVAVGVALAGCGSAMRGPDDAARARIEREVRHALQQFEAAERALDTDAVLATLDPTFYMYQDGRRVDYAQTARQIRTTMPTLREFDARFEDIEVLVLGHDSALTSMRFRDVITNAHGEQMRLWGPSTLVWKRRPEGWRIVFGDSDHYPLP